MIPSLLPGKGQGYSRASPPSGRVVSSGPEPEAWSKQGWSSPNDSTSPSLGLMEEMVKKFFGMEARGSFSAVGSEPGVHGHQGNLQRSESQRHPCHKCSRPTPAQGDPVPGLGSAGLHFIPCHLGMWLPTAFGMLWDSSQRCFQKCLDPCAFPPGPSHKLRMWGCCL